MDTDAIWLRNPSLIQGDKLELDFEFIGSDQSDSDADWFLDKDGKYLLNKKDEI